MGDAGRIARTRARASSDLPDEYLRTAAYAECRLMARFAWCSPEVLRAMDEDFKTVLLAAEACMEREDDARVRRIVEAIVASR